MRSDSTALASLRALGGTTKDPLGNHWTVENAGRTFAVAWDSGAGSKTAPGLELRRNVRTEPWWFHVSKASAFDRLRAALGLIVVVPTGDAEFDGEFIVRTDAPDLARLCFTAARRQAVRSLFATGCSWVVLEGTRVCVNWYNFSGWPDRDLAFLGQALGPLAVLTDGVAEAAPAAAGPHEIRQPWPYRITAPVLNNRPLLLTVLVLLVACGLYDPATRSRALALVGGWAFALGFLFAAGWAIQRAARKQRRAFLKGRGG